jgi:OOP family OmpA-OmpF porin
MEMNKFMTLIILPVLAVLAAGYHGQASAAPLEGNFEVSPFIGYYWFDGETAYKDHFVWGGRFGYMINDNLEAEVSSAFVSTKLDRFGQDADFVQFQADALYNFTGLGKLVPYAAAGIGLAHYDPVAEGGSEAAFLIDYGVGARYFFTDNLTARVDFRQPVVFDNAESNYMATLGISYFFGAAKHPVKVAEEAPAPEPVAEMPPPLADSDGDGVVDPEDQCPDTPARAKVDSFGCPVDSDGDGVADYLDKCPDTTAGAPVDAVGCLKDSDQDGLSDWEEMKLTGTDLHNPDSDADGLSDGDEVNKFQTNPLNPDTDGGGVKDGLEVNVAHTNPLDPADDVKEVKRIELKVYFDTNSAEVKPEYFPEIQQVAEFLKDYPEVNGNIEGHTDSRGSAAYNQKLSERRALSVVKVAEERFGVAPGRLTAIGYGGTRPVADNSTAEGRAKNRRIEAAFSSR